MIDSSHFALLVFCEQGICEGQFLLGVSHSGPTGWQLGLKSPEVLHVWHQDWDEWDGCRWDCWSRLAPPFFSPYSLVRCASLSFFIAWWPQGSWLLTWHLKAPGASVPRDQGRNYKASRTLPWNSHYTLSSVPYWSQQLQNLSKFTGKERRKNTKEFVLTFKVIQGKAFPKLIYKFLAILMKILVFKFAMIPKFVRKKMGIAA